MKNEAYDNNNSQVFQASNKRTWQFTRSLLKPFWKEIIGLMSLVFLWALDFSFRPYLIKIMLDRLSHATADTLMYTVGIPIVIYLSATLVITLVMRCYDLLLLTFLPALKKKVVTDLMQRLMKHSHRYFQNNFAGDLASRIKEITRGFSELMTIVIDRFIGHGLALIIAIFTIAHANWLLGVIMTLWIVIYLAVSLKSARRIQQLSASQSHARNQVIGLVVDILANMMTVRLFAGKKHEQSNIDYVTSVVVKKERALDLFLLKLWLFQGLLFVSVLTINCFLLLQGRQRNVITIGDFGLILTIYINITECLTNLAKDVGKFSEHWGLVTQGLQKIMVSHDIEDAPHAHPLIIRQGVITFDHVTFGHRSPQPLFDNLSVTIQAGEKVGLVGSSGSGKTTFVYLMLRLFDVAAGTIYIDDQNIALVTQDSLRRAIGIIPQDPALFHRSIKENITYGSFDVSDEDIMAAAQKAHAADFIAHLSHGYHAMVGERGAKLSGGQRQRIAIARAILKNAPIIILDEATSALDSITEQHIQDSFTELMQGKTTIVIAHRLSTLLNMDRILVFDQGSIVEDGTHQSLLQERGAYFHLWNAQIGGFLPNDEEGIETREQ